MRRTTLILLAAGAMTAAPLLAEAAYRTPNPAPGSSLSGDFNKFFSKDPSKTPAGTYRLSGPHAALFVRVPHNGGVSYSLFRFNKVSGTLDWNPTDLTKSKVNLTVDVKSLATNVPNFAEELTGDQYLKTSQFPTATFVTTSAVRTGPQTGKMTGDRTFMGVTKPVTFDVTYVGGNQSAAALMNLGFTAVGKIKRSDFGFTTALGPIGDEVTLTMDTEFAMPRPRPPLAGAPAAPAAPAR
jgi:polyisoprenoid-binding protein YceI